MCKRLQTNHKIISWRNKEMCRGQPLHNPPLVKCVQFTMRARGRSWCKQECDPTTARQHGRVQSVDVRGHQTLLARDWALKQHPVQALMELNDRISQRGGGDAASRGERDRAGGPRPDEKKNTKHTGLLAASEDPSLSINLFQTQMIAASSGW